jgi:hypothetical protein
MHSVSPIQLIFQVDAPESEEDKAVIAHVKCFGNKYLVLSFLVYID